MLAACRASEGDDPAAEVTQTAASDDSELVAPAEFAAFVADHPDAPVVNVHVPYEGHIDGTDAFVPFDSILDSTELPDDRDAPVVLYCRSGAMSAEAAADLADAGYTNVVDLDGGMIAWEAAGNDLVVDQAASDD